MMSRIGSLPGMSLNSIRLLLMMLTVTGSETFVTNVKASGTTGRMSTLDHADVSLDIIR